MGIGWIDVQSENNKNKNYVQYLQKGERKRSEPSKNRILRNI